MTRRLGELPWALAAAPEATKYRAARDAQLAADARDDSDGESHGSPKERQRGWGA